MENTSAVNVLSDINSILSSGLPPSAIVTVLWMVVNGVSEMTPRELAKGANVGLPEMDHVGLVLRMKQLGSYKRDGIRLIDPELLRLMDRVRAVREQRDCEPKPVQTAARSSRKPQQVPQDHKSA